MALVDYGSSDESGDEDNDNNGQIDVKSASIGRVKDDAQTSCETSSSRNTNETTIFSSLPKPRTQMIINGGEDIQSLLLNKSGKSKEPVKITIPSLSDFEKDDKPPPKRPKVLAENKSVGLFSVLPPPKNATVKESNRQLIPHAVKNQMSKPQTVINKSNPIKPNPSVEVNGEDDDDAEIVGSSSSFFGEAIAETKPSTTCSDEMYVLPVNESESELPGNHVPDVNTIPLPETGYNDGSGLNSNEEVGEYGDMSASNGTLELDDKALQILCGGKRKRNQMPVNIIDLSGEEIMPDSKEWLLKQLTEEKNVKSHSHKKGDGPSVQSRRKHQITYLAYQAKAQELELQNQWSANRLSRRQTQSKYGF